ncbi:response regulator receiver domain-containing protein [Tahibacter aquaticus]|jgi:hypothetical protein|uniref:Response regulator receiver domain-containing protein n=1 Tax=Tahibacter aquaticus TaxID=520092 RepID=A0A4R6YMD7_9GAMM|nr:response regulator [Tahibacter aquaticus]TDR38578.1 response regulator receiver domain-containing protein [Tahibacter aquaticus]
MERSTLSFVVGLLFWTLVATSSVHATSLARSRDGSIMAIDGDRLMKCFRHAPVPAVGDLGAEVAVAATGEEALQSAPTTRPTVVLLDIDLPDISDYEVGRRLRNIPEMSAAVAGSDREALLAAMRGHVLAKGELIGTFQRPAEPKRPRVTRS